MSSISINNLSDINNDGTFEATIDGRTSTFRLVDFQGRDPEVTYIQAETPESFGSGLDQIHFEWTKSYHVQLPLRTHTMFPIVRPRGKYDRQDYETGWAVRIDEAGEEIRSHARLMNFRRYSWSVAYNHPDQGAACFGGGVCYANNLDGGIACSTTEQVIRETLVATLALMRVPRQALGHVAVRPVIQRLLDEALEWDKKDAGMYHAGAHRALNSTNGALGAIVVNGKKCQ